MLLRMNNICKEFPGVRANWCVDLEVAEGEIHALLGENGAGKSTLMNILYGLYVPDNGTVEWMGKEVTTAKTHEALAMGIGMIHQHFMLIPKFTVAENIVLGAWGNDRNPALDIKGAAKRITELSQNYGLEVDPWKLVENLSVGEQQRVEIIKALYRKVKLLIMDEPTAVLTPQEVQELFNVLERLKKEKRSVIFISHKLDEVLRISDRISVMRDGHRVATVPNTPDLNRGKLAYLMVGREVSLRIDKPPCKPRDVVLKLENLQIGNASEKHGLNGISFEVRQGEIFGIAGVDGNGQDELAEAIMGLQKLDGGRIEMFGKDTTRWTTNQVRQLPLAYIPEDRLNVAVVMDFSVRDNLVLTKVGHPPFGSKWGMNIGLMMNNALDLIKRFNISTPSPMTLLNKLSGGNQQKVVLARETGKPVDFILAVQPTRGLDIDATRFVHEVMLAAREHGAAILYISTELEEIIGLSDTICVIYEGKLVGRVPADQADLQTIGLLMAGEHVFSEKGASA